MKAHARRGDSTGENLSQVEKQAIIRYERSSQQTHFGLFVNSKLQEEKGFMGKGDKRTKKGKIFSKSYGVKRPRKKKKKPEQKEK